MHQYTGAKDGMRCSKADMGPKTVAKHIRSLMKIPRKEKILEFGMDMFEKDSCPKVLLLTAVMYIYLVTWEH
jgi:hypothetical protein